MAYTFSVNNLFLNGAMAMWKLISTLVAAGWVVKADSDGTTYAAGGGQVTGGGTGAHGLDNVDAWVRVQAPAVNGGAVVNQQREFTFQRGAAHTDWRIKYSASAGFAGGAPAILVTPSSLDELFMLGGGTDAAPTFNTGWFVPTNGFYWHVACGGAAEFYSFYAFSSQAGQLKLGNGLFLDVLSAGSFPAADVDPAVVHASNAYNSGQEYGFGGTGSGSNGSFSGSGSAIVNVTNPCYSRAWMGATSAAGAATVSNSQGVALAGYTHMGNALTMGPNPLSHQDVLLPAWWIRPSTSTAPNGLKGCSTLFLFGSVMKPSLTLADYASAGAKDLICISGSNSQIVQTIYQPWNGSEVAT